MGDAGFVIFVTGLLCVAMTYGVRYCARGFGWMRERDADKIGPDRVALGHAAEADLERLWPWMFRLSALAIIVGLLAMVAEWVQ